LAATRDPNRVLGLNKYNVGATSPHDADQLARTTTAARVATLVSWTIRSRAKAVGSLQDNGTDAIASVRTRRAAKARALLDGIRTLDCCVKELANVHTSSARLALVPVAVLVRANFGGLRPG
jgi:hypothetical protein